MMDAVAKERMRCARYTDVNTSFRKETRYDYLYTSAIKGHDDDDPVDDDESSIDKCLEKRRESEEK